MPQIAAYSTASAGRKQRSVPGGLAWRTDFFTPTEGLENAPMAFLSESTSGRVIRTHYHALDQFHVVVSGGGTLGRRALGLNMVHFARAYTPYGPMTAGAHGLGFISLYARRDPGAHYLPEHTNALKSMVGRKPGQVSEMPIFGQTLQTHVHAFERIHDDMGLAAYSISLPAGARALAPDASASGGQYIVVTGGALMHDDSEYRALALVFAPPEDPPFELIAGASGLQVLVLHFPHQETARTQIGLAL
ncbi:MAG TPA: hypothetical protein VED01_18350 [Burkholderiales bacterium]|nr:hypothetical protein [Burkholderiales bacterium]